MVPECCMIVLILHPIGPQQCIDPIIHQVFFLGGGMKNSVKIWVCLYEIRKNSPIMSWLYPQYTVYPVFFVHIDMENVPFNSMIYHDVQRN